MTTLHMKPLPLKRMGESSLGLIHSLRFYNDSFMTHKHQLPPYTHSHTHTTEMWRRGEQPSTSSYERSLSTTSSRLSSVSTVGSMDFDSRANSMSSMTGLSPLTAHSSSASTTPTPLTPSSSQSLLSPSPFSNALTSSMGLSQPVSSPGVSSGGGFAPYNRSHSSSSSMLLTEVDSQPHGLSRYHHSVSSLNDPKQGKRKLTHKRSLSNPLNNIVLGPESPTEGDGQQRQQQLQQQSYEDRSGHNPHISTTPVNHRTPSPPIRSGSQPVISTGGASSPSSFQRSRNPQLRKVVVTAPTFSQSISNDQLMPSTNGYSNIRASGSDAFLNRQNTWQGSEEFMTPRSYSLISAHPPRPQSSQPILNHEMTSTSMVDLPMTTMYSISSEHLDQIDEYSIQNSGKSQSVPKLTFMNVSSSDDRGE